MIVWPSVLLLPTVGLRWRLLHGVTRMHLRLTGLVPTVHNGEILKDFQGLLVFNHTSYADVLVFAALLDGEVTPVAKKELARQWIAGPFLARLGAIFVDRADPASARADAERAQRAVAAGQCVVFFPEGTLTRMPGLLPFRMGAFTIAAEAGVAVLPVAFRGLRAVPAASRSHRNRAGLPMPQNATA